MYSMNIIYLHGFQSSSLSIKGQLLKHYCESDPQLARAFARLEHAATFGPRKIGRLDSGVGSGGTGGQ